MDLKSTYNKIAEDWDKDHSDDTWWQEGTNTFLSFLKPEAEILDVGCGAGLKTNYIYQKGYTKVSGIDFSESMIAIAKRKYPHIPFEVRDMYELNQVPKKYDALFVQAALLHIPKKDVSNVLRSMKERLHPNGLLYIAVKSVHEQGIEEKVETENDYGYEYERFFSYFTMPELEQYFKTLELNILWQNHADSGRKPWLQIIGRKTITK